MKHTPGPWTLDDMHVFIANENGTCKASIAGVYDIHPEDNIEGFEGYNAKLIATAPELLEMLIKMTEEFDPVKKYQEDILTEAKKLIKKATE